MNDKSDNELRNNNRIIGVAAASGVELIRYSVPVDESRRWPDLLENLCAFRCASEKQTEEYDQLQKCLGMNT